MCDHMRPRRVRRTILALLFLICAVTFAVAVLLAPRVKADTLGDAAWMWIQHHGQEFCTALTAHPDLDGATNGAKAIIAAGFTVDEAAGIAVWSTARFCPEFLPLLKRIAAQGKQALT